MPDIDDVVIIYGRKFRRGENGLYLPGKCWEIFHCTKKKECPYAITCNLWPDQPERQPSSCFSLVRGAICGRDCGTCTMKKMLANDIVVSTRKWLAGQKR